MKINNSYPKILTEETLRETISHGNNEFPFCYYLKDIWMYDFHCVDWHWHPEVEFVFLEKGTATLLVESNHYILTEGNGVFINSQVIHRFEADDHAISPNSVFFPSLLSHEKNSVKRIYCFSALI